jgi:protein-S-isoprenylcysteine O-methyltransferase Ste14
MKASAIVAVIFLLVVSLAHLFRLIFQAQIMVDTFAVPMWMSVAACIVTAALAIWLWMDNRKRRHSSA